MMDAMSNDNASYERSFSAGFEVAVDDDCSDAAGVAAAGVDCSGGGGGGGISLTGGALSTFSTTLDVFSVGFAVGAVGDAPIRGFTLCAARRGSVVV